MTRMSVHETLCGYAVLVDGRMYVYMCWSREQKSELNSISTFSSKGTLQCPPLDCPKKHSYLNFIMADEDYEAGWQTMESGMFWWQ